MEETQPRGRGAFPFETRRLIHLDGIQKMAFISTIPEEQASADVRKMYDSNREKYGYVPNFAFAFSLRPDVMQAWGGLLKSIRGKMDLRRFELVTVAAARALKSSYCSLAHGSILQRDFFTTDQVESIATDYRNSDLTPAEKAMTAYAEKIVKDASSVSQSDIDTLRSHGFLRYRDLRYRRRCRRALLLQQIAGCTGIGTGRGLSGTRREAEKKPDGGKADQRRIRGIVASGKFPVSSLLFFKRISLYKLETGN